MGIFEELNITSAIAEEVKNDVVTVNATLSPSLDNTGEPIYFTLYKSSISNAFFCACKLTVNDITINRTILNRNFINAS